MFLVKKYFTTVCMLYLATAASLEASWLKKFNAAFPKSAFFKPTTLWQRTISTIPILGAQQHDQQKKWWQGNSHFKKFSFYALLSSIGLMKAAQQTVQAEDTPTAAQEPQTPTKHLTPEDIAQDNTFSDSISWRFFSKNFQEIANELPHLEEMHKKSILPLATIFSREAEHAQEHEVFYHAHQGKLCILQDLFAELENFLHDHEQSEEFIYLRDPIQNVHSKTYLFRNNATYSPLEWQQQEQHTRYPQGLDDRCFDHDNEVQKKLLSVNVHLFGNIFNSFGESTIMQYVNYRGDSYSELTQYLTDYGLDLDHNPLDKIAGTTSEHPSILQIFIPKALFNSCTYTSEPCGTPLFHHDYVTHEELLKCLGLKNSPCKRTSSYANSQARIILDHNIMLNPASGVRIFRYTTMAAEDDKKYREQMKNAVTELFITWLERIKLGTIKSEVLERIDKTELGQKILKRSWSTGMLLPKPVAIDEEIAKLKAKLATLSIQEG